jgi:hypothetical protein
MSHQRPPQMHHHRLTIIRLIVPARRRPRVPNLRTTRTPFIFIPLTTLTRHTTPIFPTPPPTRTTTTTKKARLESIPPYAILYHEHIHGYATTHTSLPRSLALSLIHSYRSTLPFLTSFVFLHSLFIQDLPTLPFSRAFQLLFYFYFLGERLHCCKGFVVFSVGWMVGCIAGILYIHGKETIYLAVRGKGLHL